jgi:glycosyltransferase involved in cell wall biosynthesis
MKQFTLVTTVFNEIKRLDQTIADIESQTLKPSQIIITDAGSTDGTIERLLEWKQNSNINIEVVIKKGCNIAEGRNYAISEAKYELIASTDFGCRFHPEWLASIIAPFDDPSVEVVGGAFSIRHEDVVTPASRADFILQNGYPVVLDEYFSVSSRSIAYYKYVWQKIGGYNEWLTLAADDTIFWREIKRKGFKYKLVDKPYVYWLRHKTFTAYAKEAGRYGLGDGESGINFKNFWSHVAETSARYTFFMLMAVLLLYFSIGLPLAWQKWIKWWYLPLILIPLERLGLRSYRNAWQRYRAVSRQYPNFGFRMADFVNALYLIEISRWHYMLAYIKGWLLAPAKVKEGRKRLGHLPV